MMSPQHRRFTKKLPRVPTRWHGTVIGKYINRQPVWPMWLERCATYRRANTMPPLDNLSPVPTDGTQTNFTGRPCQRVALRQGVNTGTVGASEVLGGL